MGYVNAGFVRLHWRSLPGNAFKVLNEMAWATRDEDDPPRYWGGPGRLAWALGRLDSEAGDPNAADLRAVSDAIKDLLKVKVIERSRKSGPGRRAEYVLRLGPQTHEGNPRVNDSAEVPADEATHEGFPPERTRVFRSNVRGFSTSTYEGNPRTKQQENNKRETTEEKRSPQAGTSPARDSPAEQPDPPPDPETERRRQHAGLRAAYPDTATA